MLEYISMLESCVYVRKLYIHIRIRYIFRIIFTLYHRTNSYMFTCKHIIYNRYEKSSARFRNLLTR